MSAASTQRPDSPDDPGRDPYGSRLHRSVREVHRDEVLWVLDKPAGVLSHPNPPTVRASNTLLRGDYDHEDESYIIERDGPRETRVWLVHRLDLDTSGLLLCTFTAEAAAALKEDLFHRELDKEYRALLLGPPKPPIGEWEDRLARTTVDGRIEVRVKSGTKKNASTSYELLRTFPGSQLALVSLRPHTGRTHQLRVQTAKRGIPIAGDERYGDFVANRFLKEHIGLRHMFLHAHRVTLRHPRTGHRMTFSQELSQRLTLPLEALERLDRKVPRAPEGGGGRRAGATTGGGAGRRKPGSGSASGPSSDSGRGTRGGGRKKTPGGASGPSSDRVKGSRGGGRQGGRSRSPESQRPAGSGGGGGGGRHGTGKAPGTKPETSRRGGPKNPKRGGRGGRPRSR